MDWRKVKIIAGSIITIFLLYVIWYKITFSMTEVTPYEINPNIGEYSVLIATQGSEFKDEIVAEITQRLHLRKVYFRVTDVKELYEISESDWDAIVILHTWEMYRPPAAVKVFVERITDSENVMILSTSGEGSQSIEGIDTFTSESDLKKVPELSDQMIIELKEILQ